MTDENMTMDDFSKAVDESFGSFRDEDQMAWENLKQLKEAKTILNVTVDGIVNKGVVSYVEGIRGFIPASKLSLEHIDDFNDYLGKEIQVQVFDIDEEKNRLILSCREILRAKADEERRSKIDAITIGCVMDGTVESIQPYGAFINLGERLSGLVHISQISNTRIKDPSVVLNIGDPVKVKVIAIKDGKLSLSIKALNEDAEKAEQAELENIKIPESEELTTNLGSLFKNIKL